MTRALTDTKVSILMPYIPIPPVKIMPFAALTQHSAAHRLWQGQSVIGDAYQAFSYAAAAGFGVPTGTGVTLMPQRHPFEAAMQVQSLAVTTGHPVVAGYGPGAASFQKALLGAPYASQLTACREYITILRELLSDGYVDQQGEYFSYRGKLPQLQRPAIEVGLGVLRPAMARLTGEVADVAITWLTPARYVREVIAPALREGAERAGRPMPRIVAMAPVALAAPDRKPTDIALASNRAHMSAPHYIDMLRRSGIEVDIQADPEASAKQLIEGGAFLYGDPSELRDRLTEYQAAGVDEIVLNATGVHHVDKGSSALHELETLLREVPVPNGVST